MNIEELFKIVSELWFWLIILVLLIVLYPIFEIAFWFLIFLVFKTWKILRNFFKILTSSFSKKQTISVSQEIYSELSIAFEWDNVALH